MSSSRGTAELNTTLGTTETVSEWLRDFQENIPKINFHSRYDFHEQISIQQFSKSQFGPKEIQIALKLLFIIKELFQS